MGPVGDRAAYSADVWGTVGVFVLDKSEFPGGINVILVVCASDENWSLSTP